MATECVRCGQKRALGNDICEVCERELYDEQYEEAARAEAEYFSRLWAEGVRDD